MPSPATCPVCREARWASCFWNEDYISREKFEIVQCTGCGMGLTRFEGDVGKYYPREYYGAKAERFNPFVEKMVRYFRGGRARLVHQMTAKPGRVLDVGCGRGLMLDLLREKGWEAYGTELSETSAKHAREQLGLNVRVTADIRDCNFPDGFFDVVTLWHVLEHTTDVAALSAELRRILKPGGTLLIEVPNFGSWQSRLGGGKWFHIDSPRHLVHFTDASLRQLLRETDFKTGSVSTFSMEMGPYGMMQTLLNRVSRVPNFFYDLLKSRSAKILKPLAPADYRRELAVNTLLAVPASFFGFTLEVLASVFSRGSVLRITATRTA